jgi:hypothetical protein
VQRTVDIYSINHTIRPKGAAHRNIGTIVYDITVRCTLPASNCHFGYKYFAALPLSDNESQCFITTKLDK